MMWRNFFENNAENRDYVYNYCNNPYKQFHRFCVDCYMYNVVKSNTATNDDYNFLHSFNNQNEFFNMFYFCIVYK